MFDALTGAFNSTKTGTAWTQPTLGVETRISRFKIDASRSSSYYGTVSKPQMDGVSSYILIKV